MTRTPVFTPEQDAAIRQRYLAGETARQIGKSYGYSERPVLSALRRTGTERRTPSRRFVSSWTGTPEQERELIAMYAGGANVREIAKHFRCRTTLVSEVLATTGTELKHLGPRRHPRVLGNDAKIAAEYGQGASLAELAEQYGCSTPTIRDAVARAGGSLRKGRPVFWTDERERWVVEQRKAGRSQTSIAADLGVQQSAVSAALRRNGIYDPRRTRERHGSWRGGRGKTAHGYMQVLATPEDAALCKPQANGYVLEHRLVMARSLGRPLLSTETVHHINGDKTDNRLENLQLRQGRHGKGSRYVCRDCGGHNIEAAEL